VDIASIVGFPKPADLPAGERLAEGVAELTLRWEDGRSIIGAPYWENVAWHERLFSMMAALTVFYSNLNAPESELHWLLSGKVIKWVNAERVFDGWVQEGGEPPLLDLIDLVVDNHPDHRRIRTVGLHAIVGHEIDALISPESDSELGLMVGRLAQGALCDGPLQARFATTSQGKRFALTLTLDPVLLTQVVRISEIMPTGSLHSEMARQR
jgi:hypothetical protein